MAVEVQGLNKRFGQQQAVSNVSFSLRNGEVVGFLGPNGAGKSSTLRMISGYLQADSGDIQVNGIDAARQPIQARRHIGYLPEHNPLYLEMYVREYLQSVAAVYRLSQARTRIEEVIATTGLLPESNKKIGQLSKGYRQRVGLAQAILHNPPVLILDEPTSGLDPNQLHDIRQLIRNLGKEKTVLFSTHILQEVQAVCDRIIIINQGKIVADDPTDRITARVAGQVSFLAEFAEIISSERLRQHFGEATIRQGDTPQIWHFSSASNEDLRAAIYRFAVANGFTLLTLQKEQSNLEDIFKKLTGAN